MKLTRILKLSAIGLFFAALALFLLAGFIYLTQALWNGLVPDLFGGPAITYWQTLGLLVLAKIVLWPLGGGRGHWNHRRGGPGRFWAARWESMSPDDRARFKEKMKDKWCRPHSVATSAETTTTGFGA